METIDYKVITGGVTKIGEQVTKALYRGYKLVGVPFKTGNRIRVSGDPAYPNSCEYESEIGQAVCLRRWDG